MNLPAPDPKDYMPTAESPEEIRRKIFRLQDVLTNHKDKFDDVECPVTHHFAPGLYAREMFIPQDALVVGKIHKHAHVNTISQGRVLVTTEHDGVEEFTAPYTFVSKPGTKRAVLALEDTIWTTYHPTEEQDLEKIENHVIAPTYDDYEQFRLEQDEQLQIEDNS